MGSGNIDITGTRLIEKLLKINIMGREEVFLSILIESSLILLIIF